ncbi:MAG: cold shock domain-containing protein [Rhodospirillaceae bacterium]|nr:cold shock domain-containing protein [Rhodospirillaceae bacterium]
MTAKVKWFNPAKGFGFVAPTDGSPDAFLHVSVVQRYGRNSLQQGATIICDLTDGPRGPQVSDIRNIDDSTAGDDGGGFGGGGGGGGGYGGGGYGDRGGGAGYDSGSEDVIDGEVKFFSPDKGYGFGMPTGGGQDVFIGIGALQRSNLDRLESGQKVRMYVRPGKKGPQAVRIEITGQAPPRGPRDHR